MEAIWVAAEMRAGGAYAHSTLALHALATLHSSPVGSLFRNVQPVSGGQLRQWY